MRYHYRVTKYHPVLRDEEGAFRRDDWTSRSDIGRSFNGVVLTEQEYLRTEAAYLFVLEEFLRQAEIERLELRDVESHTDDQLPEIFASGALLTIPQCVDFARLALRECVWGKLVDPGCAYVHFGYDYYMYLGLPARCPETVSEAHRRGLFVETFRSPYLDSEAHRLRERGS